MPSNSGYITIHLAFTEGFAAYLGGLRGLNANSILKETENCLGLCGFDFAVRNDAGLIPGVTADQVGDFSF